MADKFINFLIWGLIIIIVIGLLWLLIEPIIWYNEKSEGRLCIRLFLLMFAVQTFATLRLYNSIVQNTRFTIKLREALIKFTNTVPGLERAMKSLSNSLGGVKTSADSLKKGVDNSTDRVEKLLERVKK